MRKTDLSVIILSYNTKDLLQQCLESVISGLCLVAGDKISNTSPVTNNQLPTTEIIVFDNASVDGSPQMVKEKFPKVKLIVNKENLGFSKGNNKAVQKASGELVLFLNSDTVVKERAIGKLVDSMKKNRRETAVCPLLLNGDGTIQKDPCYLRFPSPLTSLFYYNSVLRKLVSNFFPQLLYSISNFSTSSEVDQLPGAAFVIRKNDFLNIGVFDESFSHFFEDVDLSWRLREKGFKFFLIPEAEVVHFGRKSLEPKIKKEGVESFYYLNFKSLFKFCEKHYSSEKVFLVKAVIFLFFLARLRFGLINKLFFQ